MQLRYSFRIYPNGPQRSEPATAFGCSRLSMTMRSAPVRPPAPGQGVPGGRGSVEATDHRGEENRGTGLARRGVRRRSQTVSP
ncbi:helix-turn-helix domain-containing protein [Streptomyces sp. NPDC008121]|uniref:helix-turn-helix domain-containing protein n=1 Tax=Streptomyces sp. NPDC008121 TaxID=3364809 RepID=UPI0036E7747C